MITIAIDPGQNGGFAWQDEQGRVWADPMPEGMTAIWDYLSNWHFQISKNGQCRSVIEKTGTYMPGNAGPAAATFARHCGHLEMALYALSIPTESVSPQKWMKGFNLPKDKVERKKSIREQMQRLYPHLRVTLKTSDALGILTWALDPKFQE